MSAARYVLPDEPRPSTLSRLTVAPMWPLLATMLAGNLLGLAWFLFNGLALGSPSRVREWLLAACSLAGTAAALLLAAIASAQGWLPHAVLPYVMLVPTTIKLAVAYTLYMRQSHTLELWEYAGGTPANGMPVLFLMAFFSPNLYRMLELPALLQAVLR